jgi:hypothetical protein
VELLGGGIHDVEIHAADPVRCRRGPARRRLGGGVGWPVDAIVIEAGAFGGVPATGAGVPVDLLPGPRLQATASACRHCPGPATASLSYQAITLTNVASTTRVSSRSMTAARGSPTMSAETSGSSDTPRIPWYCSDEASCRNASLTSCAVVGRFATNTMSAIDPTGIGARTAIPSNLPDTVRETSIYARVAPKHKLQIIDALEADGKIVAMTGDGVNDAPALKSADIGIAMGMTGTEVTKEAANMILADDNFATIVEAVREGRGIFDDIKKFLRYLLSSNMGEVLTVFLGVVFAGVIGLTSGGEAVVLPLLATQILWINLITDSGPALALGVDPETEDVMARPPRKLTERVIDAQMWAGVLEIGAVMAAVTLLTIDMYLPGGVIEGTGDLNNARTAGFTVLVFCQLFNCFNARSETVSAFRHLFVNRWLWGAIAVSAALQVAVVNIEFLNTAFGTVPLSWDQWLVCIAMGSVVLWFSELRKLAARSLRRLPTPSQ